MTLTTKPIQSSDIYWKDIHHLALGAFPKEEYLSPDSLIEMAKSDNFDFLALLDNQKFIGFMVVQTYKDMAYLFFLAIDENVRSKGYGSQAISTLKRLYPNEKSNQLR